MITNSKSLEQLENNCWTDEIEFPSNLIINCRKYRKIPIKDLTTEQIRLLISQKIGIEYLVEIAIEKLEQNILEEGDLYKGDLLEAVSKIPIEFWAEKQMVFNKIEKLLELNKEKIKTDMGEEHLDQINKRIRSVLNNGYNLSSRDG